MPRRSPSPRLPAPSRAPLASAAPREASCSCRTSRLRNLLGVEGLLQQRHEVVLRHRLVVLDRGGLVARLEDDRELATGDLVERIPQEADVARLRDLLAMEVGSRRELERERVACELGRGRLLEQARDGARALAN